MATYLQLALRLICRRLGLGVRVGGAAAGGADGPRRFQPMCLVLLARLGQCGFRRRRAVLHDFRFRSLSLGGPQLILERAALLRISRQATCFGMGGISLVCLSPTV